jgi:hypothetical protein
VLGSAVTQIKEERSVLNLVAINESANKLANNTSFANDKIAI